MSHDAALLDVIAMKDAEIARLRDCRDRWKSMCQQAWNERDDTYDSLEHAEAELARLRAENDRLYAERRRDALDGQAALDEANNEVVRLRAALERVNARLAFVEHGELTPEDERRLNIQPVKLQDLLAQEPPA